MTRTHEAAARHESLSVEDLSVAAELLRSIANPVRMAMLLRIAHEPKCVHELTEELGISQPLASQHLRVLRSAHLVVGSRRGKEIAYSISDDHITHIIGDAIVHSNEVRHQKEPTN